MRRYSKKEIIDQTVQAYKNPENRAIDGFGGCEYYLAETGKMCAVGRCLTKPQGKESNDITYAFEKRDIRQRSFKPQYRGHEVEFWADIQIFHDTDAYWSNKGLTASGKACYNKLVEKWGRKFKKQNKG